MPRIPYPVLARLLALILISLTGLVQATTAVDQTSQTHEHQLDNGLRVVIHEDRRAPVVSVMLWYRVGSMDEPQGMTGISHMLEHMLFKDTEHLSPGDFSRLVSRFGGRSNAFTFTDYTGYFQQYEASRLPLALELEAERMARLRIDPEEFARELNVVLEERRQRTDDNPNALAWERFAALARPGTGYAQPIIGWRHEIEQYQPEQAMEWYQQWYSPGNAVLIVAGDVDVDESLSLVKRFFAPIPARPVPVRAKPEPLADFGERRVQMALPVQVPVLLRAWNVPSLGTANDDHDYYALTMLGGILDGGMSARIERNLVRGQQVASHAGASYQGNSRGDGLLVFSGAPVPGVSLEQLEAAFDAELASLLETPPEQAELDRVRARVLSSQVFAQDSILGQAMRIGRLVMIDRSPDFQDQLADQLAAITPEDVQAVIDRWLIPERSTTAHIHPLNQE